VQRGSEILIRRPPAEVFPYLCDPDLLRQWFSAFVAASAPFDAPVGTRLAITFKGADGHPLEVEGEVLEVDPPSRLRYRTLSERFEGEGSYHLAAVPDGTKLTHRISAKAAHGLTEIMVKPATKHAAANHAMDLRRLKDILEEGLPAPPPAGWRARA
jgi:uncharacterized protein YndB with AHSA1/START domain